MAKKVLINKLRIKRPNKNTSEDRKQNTTIDMENSNSMTFSNKLLNMSKVKKVGLGIVLFSLLLGGLYFVDTMRLDFLKSKQNINSDYKLIARDSKSYKITSIIKPLAVKDKENPINGVMMTTKEYNNLIKKHPVAVTMNNHESARPQHGLTQADIVLEILAEGGITRYVSIFYQNDNIVKIGPVRSLRYYMIEYTSGFNDAIILHHGWAGHDGAPFETYVEQTDARGAVAKWGIKSIQSEPSTYRDLEKASKSGYVHSLYTDSERMNAEVARYQQAYGWELGGKIEPLKFKFDAPIEERGNFKTIEVQFLSLSTSSYTSKFEYNKQTNSYDRFIAGKEDIDLVNNTRVSPKNVIIEWHNYRDANDGHSRLVIDMIGENEALVLRDGELIEGVWKKECRACRTQYFDKKGEKIEFVRGQIWISAAVKSGDNKVSKVLY